jgi:Peptidase U49
LDSLNSPSREPFEKIVADVLAGVPEGSTPTFSLLPEIWAAPQSIAPEKVDLLVPLLREVKLYPRTGEFRFSTSGEFLHMSDRALNLIWCSSYASWFIYQAYGRAQKNGVGVVRFDDDAEKEEAVNLYQWAIRCVRDKAYTSWPEGAPRPTRTPVHESPLHVANEVFLTAVAWMLLHESGHIAGNHPFLTSSRSLEEEHEADFFATNHVLGGVTDENVRFKRSVGIVVANALILLLELMNGPVSSRTHPPVEERISRNLRGPELESSNRIHAFATALIQFHLGAVGIFPQLDERAEFGEFVDDFCLAINRWRRSA